MHPMASAGVPATPATSERLAQLSDEIRAHHKAVERHMTRALREAIACGEKLIEAKELLPHGEFGRYLTQCGVSPSSWRIYRDLAESKSQRCVIEARSIRAALRALHPEAGLKPERMDFGKPGFTRTDNIKWVEHQWWEAMIMQGRDMTEVSRQLAKWRYERSLVRKYGIEAVRKARVRWRQERLLRGAGE